MLRGVPKGISKSKAAGTSSRQQPREQAGPAAPAASPTQAAAPPSPATALARPTLDPPSKEHIDRERQRSRRNLLAGTSAHSLRSSSSLPKAGETEAEAEIPGSLKPLLTDISTRYSDAQEAAPPLPRPLPAGGVGYRYITAAALREEAEAAAPLLLLQTQQTIEQLRLQRLRVLCRKARELSHLHRWRSVANRSASRSISTVGMYATIAVAVAPALLAGQLVAIVTGLIVTLVSASNSWMQIRQYDVKGGGHAAASAAFSDIADDIEAAMTSRGWEHVTAAFKADVAHLDSAPKPDADADSEDEADGKSLVSGCTWLRLKVRQYCLRCIGDCVRCISRASRHRQRQRFMRQLPQFADDEESDVYMTPAMIVERMSAQKLFRLATEHRFACGIAAARCVAFNRLLSAISLLGATAAGLLIFSGLGAVGSGVAVVVAASTICSKLCDPAGLAAAYSLASKSWSSIARELELLLVVSDAKVPKADAPRDRFVAVFNSSPSFKTDVVALSIGRAGGGILSPLVQRLVARSLARLSDAKGEPMFPLMFYLDNWGEAPANSLSGDAATLSLSAADSAIEQPPPPPSGLLAKATESFQAFGLVFDAAPPLPRPLPAEFDLITTDAVMRAAATSAPLSELQEPALVSVQPRPLKTRLLQSLLALYRRAHQFAAAHAAAAGKTQSTIGSVQVCCLLLGTIITIMLIEAPDLRATTLVAAVGAALISALTSFMKLAGYDERAAQHALAAAGFRDCANDIERVFSSLALTAEPAPAPAAREASSMSKEPPPLKMRSKSAPADGRESLEEVAAPLVEEEAAAPTSATPAPLAADAVSSALKEPAFKGVPITSAQMRLLPQMRMQMWYRKASERRAAHSVVATDCAEKASTGAFVQLLAATTVSVLLLLGPELASIAAVASAVISAFSGFLRFFDFNARAASNSLASRTFAAVERDLLTLLSASTDSEQQLKFEAIGERFSQASANSPSLPSKLLLEIDKADKTPLYSMIRPEALSREVEQIVEAVLASV